MEAMNKLLSVYFVQL